MDRRQMLRAAATLFSRQAIRSQQDMQGSVPGLTGQDADIVLPRLAYMFRNGATSHSMLPPSYGATILCEAICYPQECMRNLEQAAASTKPQRMSTSPHRLSWDALHADCKDAAPLHACACSTSSARGHCTA